MNATITDLTEYRKAREARRDQEFALPISQEKGEYVPAFMPVKDEMVVARYDCFYNTTPGGRGIFSLPVGYDRLEKIPRFDSMEDCRRFIDLTWHNPYKLKGMCQCPDCRRQQ